MSAQAVDGGGRGERRRRSGRVASSSGIAVSCSGSGRAGLGGVGWFGREWWCEWALRAFLSCCSGSFGRFPFRWSGAVFLRGWMGVAGGREVICRRGRLVGEGAEGMGGDGVVSGHRLRTYRTAQEVLEALAGWEMRRVLVSPGSRCTPLAVAADSVAGLGCLGRHWDECSFRVGLGGSLVVGGGSVSPVRGRGTGVCRRRRWMGEGGVSGGAGPGGLRRPPVLPFPAPGPGAPGWEGWVGLGGSGGVSGRCERSYRVAQGVLAGSRSAGPGRFFYGVGWALPEDGRLFVDAGGWLGRGRRVWAGTVL